MVVLVLGYALQNGNNSALIFKYMWDSCKYHMPVWLPFTVISIFRIFRLLLKGKFDVYLL